MSVPITTTTQTDLAYQRCLNPACGTTLAVDQVAFACPECGGVLLDIREGTIRRYRCHTGHAYSTSTLLAEIDNSIYEKLWSAVRATEERILLLRQLADASSPFDAPRSAEYRDLAVRAEEFLDSLRQSALNPAVDAEAR